MARKKLKTDDELLEKASELTGIKDKSELVRMGLVLLISRESARRLAKLGGGEPKLKGIVRRRMK